MPDTPIFLWKMRISWNSRPLFLCWPRRCFVRLRLGSRVCVGFGALLFCVLGSNKQHCSWSWTEAMVYLWSVEELVLDERHYSVETCTSWDYVWIPSENNDWLKLDGRCISDDGYGDFGNKVCYFFGFGGEWSLKGGQMKELFWCDVIMRSFQNWKNIFLIVFDFEKLGDALESDISSGAAISFSTLSARMWMSWWVISAYWLIQHLLHLWHWRYDEVHTGSELLYVCEIGWMTCRKGVWKFATLVGWT